MNKILTIITIVLLAFVVINTGFIGVGLNTQTNEINSLSEDLNVLKSNDLAFANYIIANSQAVTQLQELGKNCQLVEDTNFTQTFLCRIPKGVGE